MLQHVIVLSHTHSRKDLIQKHSSLQARVGARMKVSCCLKTAARFAEAASI